MKNTNSIKQRNLILSIIGVAFAMLSVILTLGFSTAWFKSGMTMEGELDFTKGIVISYDNYDAENSRLLYVGRKSKEETLVEKDVYSGQEFELVSPTLTPAEGTVDYFVRFKIEVTYLVDVGGEVAEERQVDFSTNNPLFEMVPTVDYHWLKGADGWYYNVGIDGQGNQISSWTGGRLNYADLKNNTYSAENPETLSIFSTLAGQRILRIGEVPDEAVTLRFKLVVDAIQSTQNAFDEAWNLYGLSVTNSIPEADNYTKFSTGIPFANYNDNVTITAVPPPGYEFSGMELNGTKVTPGIDINEATIIQIPYEEKGVSKTLDAKVYYISIRNELGYQDTCVNIDFVMPMADIGTFDFSWAKQGNLVINSDPAEARKDRGGYEYDGTKVTLTAEISVDQVEPGVTLEYKYWWLYGGQPIEGMGTEDEPLLVQGTNKSSIQIENVNQSGVYTVGCIIVTVSGDNRTDGQATYAIIDILIKPTAITIGTADADYIVERDYRYEKVEGVEQGIPQAASIPVYGLGGVKLTQGDAKLRTEDYSIRYGFGTFNYITGTTSEGWINGEDPNAIPVNVGVYSAVIIIHNPNYCIARTPEDGLPPEEIVKLQGIEYRINQISVDSVRDFIYDEHVIEDYVKRPYKPVMKIYDKEGVAAELPEDVTVNYYYVNNAIAQDEEKELGDGITNAGNYTIIAKFNKDKASANFATKPDVTFLFTINPVTSVKIKADDKTSVYNQPVEELTWSIVDNTEDQIYGDGEDKDDLGVELSCVVVEGTDVGSYVINIRSTNTNYFFTQDVNIWTGTYTVTQEVPEEVVFPVASKITYGQTLEYSILTEGQGDGTFAWQNDKIMPEANEASAQKVVFTPRDSKNFDYSTYEGYDEATGTIIRDVNVQVDKFVVFYQHNNESLSQVYTNESKEIEETISGIEIETGIYYTLIRDIDYTIEYHLNSVKDEEHKIVGSYKVYIEMINPNYIFQSTMTIAKPISDTKIEDKLDITKATLIKSDLFATKPITYGNLLIDVEFIHPEVTAAGIPGYVEIDSVQYVSASVIKPVAGTYTGAVVFTPKDTHNYNVLTVQDIDVLVNKATPEVSTNPDEQTKASAITYHRNGKLSSSVITPGKIYHNYISNKEPHSDVIEGTITWQDGNILPIVENDGYEVVFTPKDTENFNSITFTIDLTVNKATPDVEWPILNTTDQTYGTKLIEIDLSGWTTETSNGSFAWAGSPEYIYVEVPNYEAQTGYSMIFTATDTSNYDYSAQEGYKYDPISKQVTVTKNIIVKVVPYVVAPDIQQNTVSVTYDTLQKSIKFTITGIEDKLLEDTDDYKITYADQDRTQAGQYEYEIELVNRNYSFGGDDRVYEGKLTINKAAIIEISLPTANPITYGNELTGTESLNLQNAYFKSSTNVLVPGSFSWYEPTFLNAGENQSVKVRFTPDDDTDRNFDYLGFDKVNNITITVNKATLTNENITYPTAAEITYSPSQKISASALNGGAVKYQTERGEETVAGEFTWVNADTIVPTVTNYGYEVQFTSTNTNYVTPYTLPSVVSLTVKKADYVGITHNKDLTITYQHGVTLADVTGVLENWKWANENTFIYPINPVGKVGYDAVYNADPSNYNDYTSAKINVTVERGSLYIDVYPTAPNVLTYHQPLKKSIIDNSATKVYDNLTRDHQVQGAWDWANPDQKLTAGTQTPTIQFVISDTNEKNYYKATYYDATHTQNPVSPTINQTINQALGRVTFPSVNNTLTYSATQRLSNVNIVTAGKFEYFDVDTSAWVELSAGAPNSSFTWDAPTTIPTVEGAKSGYRMNYKLYDENNYNYTDDENYDHDEESIHKIITFTLAKATWGSKTHPTCQITYFKGVTLADVDLNADWWWADETTAINPSTNTQIGDAYSAVYNPDILNYNNYETTINVVVNKGILQVNGMPVPSSITYTQALSASTLSTATAEVVDKNKTTEILAGTWTWATPDTKPNAGKGNFKVVFTLTDEADIGKYQALTATADTQVELIVAKVKGYVTFPTLPEGSSWEYETTLAGIPLNNGYLEYEDPTDITGATRVRVSDSGSANFNWEDTKVMPVVGNSGYKVIYTMYNTNNVDYTSEVDYDADSKTVYAYIAPTITKKAPTVLRFPTAGQITYGQSLAQSTLTNGNTGTANQGSAGGAFAWAEPNTYPQANVDEDDPDPTTFVMEFTPNANNISNYDYSDLSKVVGSDGTMRYNPATLKVEKDILVSVKKAQIVAQGYTPPTVSDITLGEPLKASTFSGAKFVWSENGSENTNDVTCIWANGEYIIPQAGLSSAMTYTASIGDGSNFLPATFTISVNVKKATPKITQYPSIETSLIHGNTLDMSTLGKTLPGIAVQEFDATQVVTGTWTWAKRSSGIDLGSFPGVVMAYGDEILDRWDDTEDTQLSYAGIIVFTPHDTTNYNSIQIKTTDPSIYPGNAGVITLEKATPTLTTKPATVKYRRNVEFAKNVNLVSMDSETIDEKGYGYILDKYFTSQYAHGAVGTNVEGHCEWGTTNIVHTVTRQPTTEEPYQTYIFFVPNDENRFNQSAEVLFEITVIQDTYTSITAPVFQEIAYEEGINIGDIDLELTVEGGDVITSGTVVTSEGRSISGTWEWEQTPATHPQELSVGTYTSFTLKFTPSDQINYPVKTNIATTFKIAPLNPTVTFGSLGGRGAGSATKGTMIYGYVVDKVGEGLRAAYSTLGESAKNVNGETVSGYFEWYQFDKTYWDTYTVLKTEGENKWYEFTEEGRDKIFNIYRYSSTGSSGSTGSTSLPTGFERIGSTNYSSSSSNGFKAKTFYEDFTVDHVGGDGKTVHVNRSPLEYISKDYYFVCRFVPNNTSINVVVSNPYILNVSRNKVTFDMNDTDFKNSNKDINLSLLYQRYGADIANVLDPNHDDVIEIYLTYGQSIDGAIAASQENAYSTQLKEQITGGVGSTGLEGGEDNAKRAFSYWLEYDRWGNLVNDTQPAFDKGRGAGSYGAVWGYRVRVPYDGAIVPYSGKIVQGEGFYMIGDEVTIKVAKRAKGANPFELNTITDEYGYNWWSWSDNYQNNDLFEDYTLINDEENYIYGFGSPNLESVYVNQSDPDYVIIKFTMVGENIVLNLGYARYQNGQSKFPLNIQVDSSVQALDGGNAISANAYKLPNVLETITIDKQAIKNGVVQGLEKVTINGTTVYDYTNPSASVTTPSGVNTFTVSTVGDVVKFTFKIDLVRPTINSTSPVKVVVTYKADDGSMYNNSIVSFIEQGPSGSTFVTKSQTEVAETAGDIKSYSFARNYQSSDPRYELKNITINGEEIDITASTTATTANGITYTLTVGADYALDITSKAETIITVIGTYIYDSAALFTCESSDKVINQEYAENNTYHYSDVGIKNVAKQIVIGEKTYVLETIKINGALVYTHSTDYAEGSTITKTTAAANGAVAYNITMSSGDTIAVAITNQEGKLITVLVTYALSE